MFAQFNFSAVLVSAVLHMILGILWYTVFFKKAFLVLMGVTSEHMSDADSQRAAVHGYFASFFSYILMGVILSYFIIFTGTTTALEGLKLGLLCGAGFTLTTMLPNHYFAKKPLKLALINIAYHMVGLSLMGIILTVWRKL